MNNPIQKKHDADHAGGGKEVVFYSEGVELPPLSFPVKTKYDEIDESELIPPEQAFQIFANKLFVSNPYSTKRIVNDETMIQSNESPLVRLSRLKRELETLESDCVSKDDFGLFQDQFIQMKQQLNTLSTSQQQKQIGLLSSIDESVTALNSSSSQSTHVAPSTSLVENTSLQIEERLIRLEKLLGEKAISSSSGDAQMSIVSRLQTLENLLQKLDEKKLDVLHKRSKVIRQDLEAAAKARNKISNMSGSTDDSKIITTLYDGLQSLHGMSDHLPILSSRLQALAYQHADGATRMKRFTMMEQITTDLSKQVQSIESTLLSLDTSMKDNAIVMQENVKRLEERINAL